MSPSNKAATLWSLVIASILIQPLLVNTSSERIADDFQRLCLHAGWSCNKLIKYGAGNYSTIKSNDRKNQVIKSTKDVFRLTINEHQNNPLVNKNIKKNGENAHDKWIDYNGKVFCCSVKGDGVLYVRRNGYPVGAETVDMVKRHHRNDLSSRRYAFYKAWYGARHYC